MYAQIYDIESCKLVEVDQTKRMVQVLADLIWSELTDQCNGGESFKTWAATRC